MSTNGCIAMILAGGRGERMGALTRYCSKPAIHFGGKHRIIDFALNNCHNSGLNTVGILSQYFSGDLHTYINYRHTTEGADIHMLPSSNDMDFYRGTADAVYKNIGFIEQFHPDCVLILAGDHIYDMDYRDLIAFHWKNDADVTVASTVVPPGEASRFGMILGDENGRVQYFEEKPRHSFSELASMGVYVFKWSTLKLYLRMNSMNPLSRHDFGRNILPEMLVSGESVYTYRFDSYWRDVGTVHSLWEAHMDLLGTPDRHISGMPYDVGRGASVRQSILSEGNSIFGRVEHSVLGSFVTVDQGAEITDSVIMQGAYIGANAKVRNAVVGAKAVIMDNTVIGTEDGTDIFVDDTVCAQGVSLVAPWLYIEEGMRFRAGSHICGEKRQQSATLTNAAGTSINPCPYRANGHRATRQIVSV